MTLSVRRFAPNTVRQPRNAVRHGLEQVSDSVGMRRPRPKASRPRPHIRKSPRHPRSYTPLSDALSQLRIPGAVGQ